MPLHGYWCFSFCSLQMIIRFVRSAVGTQLTRSKKCSCQQARTRGVRVCVCGSAWDPYRHTCRALHARLSKVYFRRSLVARVQHFVVAYVQYRRAGDVLNPPPPLIKILYIITTSQGVGCLYGCGTPPQVIANSVAKQMKANCSFIFFENGRLIVVVASCDVLWAWTKQILGSLSL